MLLNMHNSEIDKIFKRYQSDLLKRTFSVKGDGMVVRLDVAEKALRNGVEDAFAYYADYEEEEIK